MSRKTLIAAMLVTLAAASAGAQESKVTKSSKGAAAQQAKVEKASKEAAALKAAAKVSEEAARATALASVPGATVKEGELEKEKGNLIWSFDLKLAGKKGVEEVQVDAITGKIISREHESDAKEAKEAKDEAKSKIKTVKPATRKP